MPSALTKPVARRVTDDRGLPLVVTLTAEGILFRRPRQRRTYLLPFSAGETRAQMLEARLVAAPSTRAKRANRNLLR
jgi:hypothetical protein